VDKLFTLLDIDQTDVPEIVAEVLSLIDTYGLEQYSEGEQDGWSEGYDSGQMDAEMSGE
jgi:hypothetical protein